MKIIKRAVKKSLKKLTTKLMTKNEIRKIKDKRRQDTIHLLKNKKSKLIISFLKTMEEKSLMIGIENFLHLQENLIINIFPNFYLFQK